MEKVFERFLKNDTSVIVIGSCLFWVTAIFYCIYLGDQLPYPDERWYFFDYGQNLAKLGMFSLDGIRPTTFHPPGYPLFLGLIILLRLGITSARLLNFLALFLTMMYLKTMLDDQSHKLAALFSVMLAFGYPVLFYSAGTLFPQTIGAFFFILSILLYWKKSFRFKHAVLSGISLGIAILIIPTFLFVPFYFVFFSIFIRKDNLLKIGLLLIMVFVTIAPWTLRNYLVFNRFQLISSNFGTNFLIGNSPQTTINNGPAASIGVTKIMDEASYLGLDEFERDKFYTKRAFMFIKQDPKHYLSLYFWKVANYFNFRNELLTFSESSVAKDIVMLFTYGILVLVAFIRIVFLCQYPISKFEVFLIILYVGNAFISALAFTRIRYRLPFDYLLIIIVALFLEKILLEKKIL